MLNQNAIDKIEVYTFIDHSNVIITDHAIERALERFNLSKTNKSKVTEWIRNKYANSSFKSTVTGDRHGMGRLFVNNDIGIVLDIYKDIILTVYPIEIKKNVRTKLQEYLMNECNRISKSLKLKERKYRRLIVELNLEKATLERDLLYIRKDCKRNSIIARINAIEISIAEMMKELYDLQMEKEEIEISLSAQSLRLN